MNKKTKPEANSIEAYIAYYGEQLGKLEWARHVADTKIRAYHKRKLNEEKKRGHMRAERIYNSISRILSLNIDEIDSKSEDELYQYLINRMVLLIRETKIRE